MTISDASASATVAPIVEVSGLSKRFGRTLALDGLDLAINRNEMFALLGPNGAGKTTLIHILCTLLRPDSGTARIAGFDVVRQPLRARRHIGIVFQEPSLDGRLTVEENLNFHGLVHRVPWRLRRRRITEMLELVELSDTRHRLVRTLSVGMKRRVEIARALVHDAEMVIFDEPTVGLDAQSRERIWAYLRKLRAERGITLVVTTHYIDEVESCDRVCILDHGKVLALDTPEALRARFGIEQVRVTPRSAASSQAIAAQYPGALVEPGGEIVIPGASADVVDRVRGNFGTEISGVVIERPSLQSVFLTLTGREIREEPEAPAVVARPNSRTGEPVN
ncbi:MAG: ABC transporter ATP-binding protein [Bauldia sp.]